MDRPAKVTAQVAPYLTAIRQARAGGWGWREIAARVAPGATPDSVRAAVKACRYEVEQMPLPEQITVAASFAPIAKPGGVVQTEKQGRYSEIGRNKQSEIDALFNNGK